MSFLKKFLSSYENKKVLSEINRQNIINEIRYRDLLEILKFRPKYNPKDLVSVACEEKVAIQSLDHITPKGTANDNTRWPAFVRRCEEIFQKQPPPPYFPEENCLSYLDLGCSGGGLVFDFVLRDHFAIGLEGSDYSLKRLRAEWRTIPDNLFTCNIAKQWDIISKKDGTNVEFHVISAWDVLEHLSKPELESLFFNVRKHLKNNGIFVGSVSTRPASNKSNLHVTVMNKSEWMKFFEANNFINVFEKTAFNSEDFPRTPDKGFHFILSKNADIPDSKL